MPDSAQVLKRTVIPQLMGANRKVDADTGNETWVFIGFGESWEFELAPEEKKALLTTFTGGVEIAKEMPQ